MLPWVCRRMLRKAICEQRGSGSRQATRRSTGCSLGVRSPKTWQISADRLAGSLTIRVGVAGSEGAAAPWE
ncbi:hypothetical protein GCM10017557_81290 [Streptomyces aurantiacus]|uniref:Uncharacterized protein n=1 Tax=Streptomyces aurantiacus TaxID=47760 RepID=A0A7G1PH38_9ACTN|nr:hypothetical protein GCM10017557_81290 [Streptomyces aurantiacus]